MFYFVMLTQGSASIGNNGMMKLSETLKTSVCFHSFNNHKVKGGEVSADSGDYWAVGGINL